MHLSYIPVRFHLRFSSPVLADNPPLFVLRSLMGMQLRSMSCVSPKTKCPDCMYKTSCAYSFLFETILQSENGVLPGRNRASHPFAFTKGDFAVGVKMSEYDFTMTLFGQAIDYLPYIYSAFVRAGELGIFKSRTRFSVAEVSAFGPPLLDAEKRIAADFCGRDFSFSDTGIEERHGEVLVELESPLRFKIGGKYTADFSAQDFMSCLYRRACTLSQLYGSNDEIKYELNETLSIIEKKLRWSENQHYSARQKNAMKLGGVTGTFKITGTFTSEDLKLLEFASIANAGKNTNFGLGQMDFWTKWE